MCYKWPGPRCSPHARKRLASARKAYKSNPTEETYARLKEAEGNYLTSPEGIKKLKVKAERTKKPADIARYQHYKNARAAQIAEYKESLKVNDSAPKVDPQAKPELDPLPASGPINGKQSITHAYESSLSYDGPKPAWWDDYEKKAREDAGHPVIADGKREIIDVMDTDEGKIAVLWEEHSTSDNDQYVGEKGFQVQQLAYRSFETGEVLGYVKVSSQNPASMKTAFGKDQYTAFRYDSAYGGTSYYRAKKLEESGNPDPDELARTYWLDNVRASDRGVTTEDGQYVPSYSVSEKHIPQDIKKIKADLKERSAAILPQIRAGMAYYKHPYVDYSRMEGSLQGKGYGTAAYVYTARKLAQEGKALRASGLQSDSALPLWGRLKKNFPGHVKPITLAKPRNPREKQSSLIFDFR